MSSGHDLEKGDHFRINAEVWLRTLLAITGDKERKEEVVQTVAQMTGFTTEKVGIIMAATISVLINDTRAK
jgi:hypothetical protein